MPEHLAIETKTEPSVLIGVPLPQILIIDRATKGQDSSFPPDFVEDLASSCPFHFIREAALPNQSIYFFCGLLPALTGVASNQGLSQVFREIVMRVRK